MPGAEILGREVVAADATQVVVDVLGAHRLPPPVVIDVLEQMLPGEFLAALHDAGGRWVGEPRGLLHPALAPEADLQGGGACVHMPVAQRGQPERAVFGGVFLVAHAHRGAVQQPHDGRDHRLQRQRPAPQVARHRAADARQGAAELAQAVELLLPLLRLPVGVVAVLLAAPRIAAGGLQMTAWIGADPHLGVGGRDRQAPDAVELCGVADRAARGAQIHEAFAAPHPGPAGCVVLRINEFCWHRASVLLPRGRGVGAGRFRL
jgi:hypothetical protein